MLPYSFGITVMPEWFQYEGIDPVLDRIQSAGADAIVTSPYLLERVAEGQGSREPPPDGEEGKVRPLERQLFGATELWIRTSPAFAHNLELYRDLRYQPSPPTPLTNANAELLDRVFEAAGRRGLQVLLQIMAASPPAYRVQFSAAWEDDQCLLPSGQRHDKRVDRNGSLSSPHIVAYVTTLLRELAARYPTVAGFRLDWPEYPPYDLGSAMLDFNRAAHAAMRAAGEEPEDVRRAAEAWLSAAKASAQGAAGKGAVAAFDALAPLWSELLAPSTALRALFGSKASASLNLLRQCRAALDAVPGPRRRLEPQIMPPPLHRLSGFPLERAAGAADAIGVKLYTMHWPMIARYWARDLVGAIEGPAADAVSAAVGRLFGCIDTVPEQPSLYRYPPPDLAHPVSAAALVEKLAYAKRHSGGVPVVSFNHSYGPLSDVLHRLAQGRRGVDAVWINRYGYLSDEKLAAVASMMRNAPAG